MAGGPGVYGRSKNDILSGKQDLIEYNINKWKNSLTDNSLAEESGAMRQGVRYFFG